jgi:NADP-dependent 3-hydroxy acid dehydrogenase YdfG
MSGGAERIAWVTGGGSGIGEAGAAALMADGWTVVISGRRPDVLAATAKELGARGRPIDPLGSMLSACPK